VVLVDGGRIVAEGTHQGLLASSAAYRSVLAAAQAGDDAEGASPGADSEPVEEATV
jgi:hypothetical protein